MRKLLLLVACIGCFAFAMAQSRVITGKVTDNSGAPVPYATVQVKGSKAAVAADKDGRFSIKAAPGDVLVFSSSSTERKEIKIGSSSADLSVMVNPASQNLSEVIVTTALGIKRQARELGYATAQIKSSQLNQAAVINPATGLAAKVSGVDIRLADNGVNPQVKVTFRGSRSITGSNSALIVVDGVPVDESYLSNLNPNDIDDVTILKGSNAAALYGMSASNGVMILTTKKGKGKFSLNYQNTVSWESISYFPAIQNEYSGFGGEPGGTYPNPATGGLIQFTDPSTGLANTVPFENEAYGSAYNSKDFHMDSIPIGVKADGTSWVYTPYRAAPNGRKDFFQTGVSDQNQLSGSFGNSWGGLYFSGDHTTKQGVVPKDKYTRNGGRIDGNLNFGRFSASGGISYNNVSTDIAGNSYNQNRPVYWAVMNQLPSTDLRAIRDISQFQNNKGFVNAYFPNPWWQVDEARSHSSTNQLVSNLQLNYKVKNWLSITARGGYSRTSANAPSYIDSISFPPFLGAGGGPWGFGSIATFPGPQGLQRELIKMHYDDANADLFATLTKKMDKFKYTLIVGGNYRRRTSWGSWYSNQINSGPVVGQNVVPPSSTTITAADGSATQVLQYKRNDQSAYGDLTIGYDSWLFLHGSFRNDWTSILDPNNRSFSYPSIDMSAVLSDKLEFLKNSNTISFLKLRVGYAGTGNVSIANYKKLGVMGNVAAGTDVNGIPGGYTLGLPDFGGYTIYPIAAVGLGFPFGNVNGFSQNVHTVQPGLQPEKTKSKEAGIQLGLFKNRVNVEVNYYDQVSINQTIFLQASNASGIQDELKNAGKVNNSGVEFDLSLTPLIKAGDFHFDLSGNFSYQNSKVIDIDGGEALLDQINFGTQIIGGIYAIAGKSYPQLKVNDFERDPQGHIIVDAQTGLPNLSHNQTDVGGTNYKYFVGLSPSFSYKNLTLRAVFDYRGGAKILHEEGNAMDFAGMYQGDAVNRFNFVIPNSVIDAGGGHFVPNSNVPITSVAGLPVPIYWWANFYNQAGAPYVTSAAFWKLRELALTYTVPGKLLGEQKIIRGLDLSLIGRNLFMWRPKTNNLTDPEFSTNGGGNAVGYSTEYQTPPTRIISLSIRANIF